MKLLLDENLPKRLKTHFPEHEIFTVRDMGWNGKDNGELLQAMIDTGFEVLFTFDKNLEHQQNFEKYPVAVFALDAENNTYKILRKLIPLITQELGKPLKKGIIKINL